MAETVTRNSSDGGSLTTDVVVSLAAFGLVSMIMTQLERRKQQQHQQQGKQSERSRPLPPPRSPENLVGYLHQHGGKRWQQYTLDTELFVRNCPKVELHVHLDGSLDPDFLWHCLKQYDDSPNSNEWISCLPVSTTLPWDVQNPLPVRNLVEQCRTEDDFHELCTCRRGQRSLQNMLTCFEVFLPLVRGAPPALLLVEELAYDFCRRQWEQNVVYTEVRHCPHLLMEEKAAVSGSFDMDMASSDDNTSHDENAMDKKKQQQQSRLASARSVMQAITRGLQRGCSEYNIIVNQILCAINWRPDWAWDVLELAQEFQTTKQPCGVVGIDIAAGEEHFDKHTFPHLYQAHFDMTQKAQALGIPITIHAGETPNGGMEHVRRAVALEKDGYGAKRIGHGYRMVDSIELMQQLAKDKIHVEICPTSSVETGGWIFEESQAKPEHELVMPKKPWKDHPGLTMMKHGVSVSLNSDDPAVFHTSLSWQYRIALAKMGLSQEEVMNTNLNAIAGSFGSEKEKESTRRIVRSFIAQISNGGKHGDANDRFRDRVRDPS